MKYLQQRRSELNEKLNKKCYTVFNNSYDFIDVVISNEYEEVLPIVTRKVELLEALMMAFIEHGLNLELLDDIDEHISNIHLRNVNERAVQ